jgi:ribosomal protein L34E
MSHCEKCGKELSHNEIGASKKFINRASTSFLCRKCLAERFNIPPEFIDSKIEQLKKQGCTLFV